MLDSGPDTLILHLFICLESIRFLAPNSFIPVEEKSNCKSLWWLWVADHAAVIGVFPNRSEGI